MRDANGYLSSDHFLLFVPSIILGNRHCLQQPTRLDELDHKTQTTRDRAEQSCRSELKGDHSK